MKTSPYDSADSMVKKNTTGSVHSKNEGRATASDRNLAMESLAAVLWTLFSLLPLFSFIAVVLVTGMVRVSLKKKIIGRKETPYMISWV